MKKIKVEATLELLPDDGEEWNERTINDMIIERVREWEDELIGLTVKDVRYELMEE